MVSANEKWDIYVKLDGQKAFPFGTKISRKNLGGNIQEKVIWMEILGKFISTKRDVNTSHSKSCTGALVAFPNINARYG